MDLFDDDKRLFMAPVVALHTAVQAAFGAGACSCIRCKSSAGDEVGYLQGHTFAIDGRSVHRKFARTSHSDVRGDLAKAWKSYYKTELPAQGAADMSAISQLVPYPHGSRLTTLLHAAGVVRQVENETHFAVGAF